MWAGRHGDWRLGGLLIADPRILNSPASLIALSRIADDVGRTARSRLRSRFGVTLAGDPATTKEVIQLLMGEMGTDSALAERIAVHPVMRADSALFYRFLSALDWYPALCDQALYTYLGALDDQR